MFVCCTVILRVLEVNLCKTQSRQYQTPKYYEYVVYSTVFYLNLLFNVLFSSLGVIIMYHLSEVFPVVGLSHVIFTDSIKLCISYGALEFNVARFANIS